MIASNCQEEWKQGFWEKMMLELEPEAKWETLPGKRSFGS